MLYRYGEFVARRARLLLVVSVLLMVGAGILAAGAFGKLQSGGFDDPGAQSTQAQQLIDERFGGESNLVLLVTADDGRGRLPRRRRRRARRRPGGSPTSPT